MKSTPVIVFVVSVGIVALSIFFLMDKGGSNLDDQTKPLTLYYAAGLRIPVEEVIAEYKKKYNIQIITIPKGSNELLSIIKGGKSGDLYLAADQQYMEAARKKNIEIREVIPIAYQHPVLAVHKGNPLGIKNLADLENPKVKLHLADPDRAAISKAARENLGEPEWKKIWSNITSSHGTVNDVANAIKLNKNAVGIIWNPTAFQYDEIEVVPFKALEKSKNQMVISVLGKSQQPTRALHFARYLTARDKGLKSFEKHGYEVTQGDDWSEKPEIRLFTGTLMLPAIQETIDEFKKREGCVISVKPNGCGILVGMINGAGARPDLYFACDDSYMMKVRDKFRKPQPISENKMVIIVSKKKADQLNISKLEDLATPGLKLSFADSKQSALGALTVKLLTKRGIYEQVKKNINATSPTAANVVTSVAVGGLDAGIVYLANTYKRKSDLVIINIDDKNALAHQPLAISLSTKHFYLCERLVQQIMQPKSLKKFEKLGFRITIQYGSK